MDDGAKGKHVTFNKGKLKEILENVRNTTFRDVVLYMYQPTDPASLGVIRFLFGKYI